MIINLQPQNPEIRTLKIISETLKEGGVYIFPTDTAYAMITDAQSKSGLEKMNRLKNMEKNKPLSLLCADISMASEFIENLPNDAHRMMKRLTPGPYTFIFKANRNLPRATLSNQKNKFIGIRIPDNIYIQTLLQVHKNPLTSTSVFSEGEFTTQIDDLEINYGKKLDGIINGGDLELEFSTILDFSNGFPEIIREGKGIEAVREFI
jgi:tRNA threonylcarbamoyl adenosine modification protein (Sua5/YciO/YrdC/YwlC family)